MITKPRPGISKLCLGCGTLLAQSLVAEGADYHLLCHPRRRRLRVVRMEGGPDYVDSRHVDVGSLIS